MANEERSKIFDSHMHIGSWGTNEVYGYNITPFKGRGMDSVERVIACLNKNRVERAVVVPIYTPNNLQAYRTIVKLHFVLNGTATRHRDHQYQQ